MKNKSSRSRSQKRNRHHKSRSHSRTHKRGRSRLQKGGSSILPSSLLSNASNSHFTGIGFTDPSSTPTGCTGSINSPSALRGANVFTTIGGIKMPVSTKGGSRYRRECVKCNQRVCACKNKSRTHRVQRGGNTNGYSIGGIHLKSSLSGIATNYHTPYDSCKG